eukprot:18706-Chlamydomonas_euryale.AAC.6
MPTTRTPTNQTNGRARAGPLQPDVCPCAAARAPAARMAARAALLRAAEAARLQPAAPGQHSVGAVGDAGDAVATVARRLCARGARTAGEL